MFCLSFVIIQLATQHGQATHEPEQKPHLGIEINMVRQASHSNAHRGQHIATAHGLQPQAAAVVG